MLRSRNRVRYGVALTALTVAIAAPAAAWAAEGEQPVDTASPDAAQSSGAADQSAAQPDAGADSDIIVTGIRASSERAQLIKRDAESVVEAVTLQDLGKFSDVNVADVLQRVPGVQIERNDQGINGDRASIRGLGPSYTQITFNGRVPLTGGDGGIGNLRQINLDVLPTEIISGLLVYKTPAAEMVDPGLAGAIDVQTLKPLDYRSPFGHDTFGSLTVRGDYDDQAKRIIPRVSGVVGAKLLDDTLGVYVAGVWSRGKTNNHEIFSRFANRNLSFDDNGDHVVDRTINGVLVPDRITTSLDSGTIRRLGLSSGIQWRPDDHWEVNAEFTYAGLFNDQDRTYGDIQLNTVNSVYQGIASPGGYTVKDGLLMALDTSKLYYPNGAAPVYYNPQPLHYNNHQQVYTGGLNAKYKGEGWSFGLDYGFSKVEFTQDLRLFSGGTSAANYGVTYDGTGEVPVMSGITNVLPAAGNTFNSFFARLYKNDSHAHSVKADLKIDVTSDVAIKLGARYQDTLVDVGSNSVSKSIGATQAAQLNGIMLPGGTFDFVNGFGVSVPYMSYPAGAAAVPDIANVTYDASNFNPAFGFKDHERLWEFYGQTDFKGSLGDLPFEGNAGVHAVHVGLTSDAAVTTSLNNGLNLLVSQTTAPISDSNAYWRFLPAFNLNLHPRDNINLRLGISRVMSRAEYEDTSPKSAVAFYDRRLSDIDPTQNGTATVGNTKLKPLTAWQYDATLEYYTPNRGAFYASVFYKQITDFIIRVVDSNVSIPGIVDPQASYDGLGARLLNVTHPVNASGGRVFGFELGLDQPLTFLPSPFDGFGVQANYTFVDSKINLNNSSSYTSFGFPGASKHNANGVIYYEKGPFSTRVAYSYRSNYFQALGGGVDRATQPTFTKGYGQLNASISYKVTPHVEVSANAVNLTGANRRDYIYDVEQFRSYIQRSRVFSLSLRGAF